MRQAHPSPEDIQLHADLCQVTGVSDMPRHVRVYPLPSATGSEADVDWRGTGGWAMTGEAFEQWRIQGLSPAGLREAWQVWQDPKLSEPQRFAALADVANRYVVRRGELSGAQQSFARWDDYDERWVYPEHSDGRLILAGVSEPYPGFWPWEAVIAAEVHDDFTALWPYLAG